MERAPANDLAGGVVAQLGVEHTFFPASFFSSGADGDGCSSKCVGCAAITSRRVTSIAVLVGDGRGAMRRVQWHIVTMSPCAAPGGIRHGSVASIPHCYC